MLRFNSASFSGAFLLTAIIAVNSISAQTAGSQNSPFLPPASAAPTSANNTAPYSLTGMTVVGKDTLIGVTRTSDKRSVWVPVGKTVGEITAISYDAAKDQAVIRANGKLETLTMKKSAVVVGMPAVVRAPAPNTASGTPATTPPPVDVPTGPMSVQEEKEMEARMLVTDLLEIGQRQRKAYEEAQRQAAAKNATKPAPPPPATATPKP